MNDPLQCLTCGAVVMGGTQFCGQCGADFREAAPPPPSPFLGGSALIAGLLSVMIGILGPVALVAGLIAARQRGPATVAKWCGLVGAILGLVACARIAAAVIALCAAAMSLSPSPY